METANTTETNEMLIRDLIHNRLEATRNRDIEGALASYAQDVISYDVVDPLVYRGKDEIRKRLKEWVSSFSGPIGLEISDLKICNNTGLAFCHGLCHVSATTNDGKNLAMWWRETSCLTKTEGIWTITHIHSSVPFNVETGKASLDLTPEN